MHQNGLFITYTALILIKSAFDSNCRSNQEIETEAHSHPIFFGKRTIFTEQAHNLLWKILKVVNEARVSSGHVLR